MGELKTAHKGVIWVIEVEWKRRKNKGITYLTPSEAE